MVEQNYEDLLGPEAAAGRWYRRPAPHAVFVVRGPDAVDFLQRLCSQDVAGMAPGEARPAAFLDGKGKLVATCTAGRGEDGVWVEAPAAHVETVAELLERYQFTERLELARRPDWVCGEVLGRDAPAALGLEPGRCAELEGGGLLTTGARHRLSWARWHAPEAFFAEPPWAGLGLRPVDDGLAECLRICAGLVAVGVDSEPTTLALEAALDDHVSTTKGCYTGQEIVARIHTYGHVNRKLCLLEIAAPAEVARGTALLEPEEGAPVGRVMSSALLPDGRRRVALGYLPADFRAPGTALRLADPRGPAVQVVGFEPAQDSAR